MKSACRDRKGSCARRPWVRGKVALGGSGSGSCPTLGFVPVTEGGVLAPAPTGDGQGCPRLLPPGCGCGAQTLLPRRIPAHPLSPLGASAGGQGCWSQSGAALPSGNSRPRGFPCPDVPHLTSTSVLHTHTSPSRARALSHASGLSLPGAPSPSALPGKSPSPIPPPRNSVGLSPTPHHVPFPPWCPHGPSRPIL